MQVGIGFPAIEASEREIRRRAGVTRSSVRFDQSETQYCENAIMNTSVNPPPIIPRQGDLFFC
jgi:hypothetical protein